MNPIAMMFALIAGVILLPALYMGISNYGDQIRATATALQMAHIQKAAEAYITTNAAAVDANSTASSPAIITVPMLVNTGFLPNGFNSMNPYGQTWQVQVLQPAANQLQALVLGVGGNAITAKQSGMIATTAGDSGGVIGGGSGDLAVPGCSGGEACGAYAGWSVSTAGYQNVAAAHPAALIEYANNQLQSDYLYRVAVPGQPQLNTMQTNLNMGANNINNAQNVNVNQNAEAGPADPMGAYGSCVLDADNHCTGQIEAAGTTEADEPPGWQGGLTTRDLMGVNGTLAEGPPGSVQAQMTDFGNGSAGGGGDVNVFDPANGNYAVMNSANTGATPEIYTNGIIDGNTFGGNGYAMYNGSWWANNAGDSSQTGTATANKVYTNNDVRFQQTGYSAGGSCSGVAVVNGYANGNAGQLLYCQNGQWQAMGGGGYTQVVSYGMGPSNSYGFGWYKMCTVNGFYGFGENANVYPVSGPNAFGQFYWDGYDDSIPNHSMGNTVYCYN